MKHNTSREVKVFLLVRKSRGLYMKLKVFIALFTRAYSWLDLIKKSSLHIQIRFLHTDFNIILLCATNSLQISKQIFYRFPITITGVTWPTHLMLLTLIVVLRVIIISNNYYCYINILWHNNESGKMLPRLLRSRRDTSWGVRLHDLHQVSSIPHTLAVLTSG